jgi:anaerobic ribonucleoside-triphosphate reductase activating protein
VGCHKQCEKCANPELRVPDSNKELSKENIAAMCLAIDFNKVEGVTITGGEPFYNPEGLYDLLKNLSDKVEDILIFTGYTYEELRVMDNIYIKKALPLIDVLVAGEYIDERNDNNTPLVASTNQKLIIFKEKLRERYSLYMEQGRKIENVFYDNNMISVGIHNRREM